VARIFDSSFEGRDKVTRKRHGLPWLTAELSSLRELYQEGKSLQEMCEMLERPATGTLAKLVGVGCLRREMDTRSYRSTYYCRMPLAEDTADVNEAINQTETTEKEPTMTAKLIENKVYINGTDATDLSDKEIFVLIAKTEAEIDRMKAIKTPSKKLAAAIDKLQEDVVKLAAYVDER
jgi:hypothetical protein